LQNKKISLVKLLKVTGEWSDNSKKFRYDMGD